MGEDAMGPFKLLIDGALVDGDSTMEVLNPATEAVLATCPRASKAQLDQAVAAAKAAFPAWAAKPIEERRAALLAKADAIQAAARFAPAERLLVETDAPYLAPVPHRGKLNEPAFVHYVAEEIARLRGIAFEQFAEATTRNFCRLFNVTLTDHDQDLAAA